MKAHDAVAGLEFRHAAPGLDYRPSQFVPQYPRRIHKSLLDFLDVGAADSARGHAKEHFAFANFGDRHRFDDNLPFAPIDSRAHLAAVRRRPVLRSELFDGLAHGLLAMRHFLNRAAAAPLSCAESRPT